MSFIYEFFSEALMNMMNDLIMARKANRRWKSKREREEERLSVSEGLLTIFGKTSFIFYPTKRKTYFRLL